MRLWLKGAYECPPRRSTGKELSRSSSERTLTSKGGNSRRRRNKHKKHFS